MPYHIMSVPCLRVIQDSATGLATIVDIIERTRVPENEKRSFPPFKMLSKWGRDSELNENETFEIKIGIKHASTKKQQEIDKFKVTIPEGIPGVTMVLDFGEITANELGGWHIIVSSKKSTKSRWKEEAKIPLVIEMEPKEGEEAT